MATFVAGSALVADKSCYFILLPRALVYHFHDNYSKCLGTHVCFTGKKTSLDVWRLCQVQLRKRGECLEASLARAHAERGWLGWVDGVINVQRSGAGLRLQMDISCEPHS